MVGISELDIKIGIGWLMLVDSFLPMKFSDKV